MYRGASIKGRGPERDVDSQNEGGLNPGGMEGAMPGERILRVRVDELLWRHLDRVRAEVRRKGTSCSIWEECNPSGYLCAIVA